MQHLDAIKDQLRSELPQKGASYVIKTLEGLLPSNSPKYDVLVALKADYRKLKLEVLEGLLSKAEENRQQAQIRRRLLDFLRGLEPEDFDKKARRSHLAPEQKIKKGHVLYRIPKQMQFEQESRCRVRIAFDKEMIVEDLDLDEDTELRSGIRISDYMKVEVVDPSPDGVFDIRTTSEPVQPIDADDFTEWKFYVKPKQVGEHILELKVNIMLQVDGEVRVREKTLEESVVIITEAPAQDTAEQPWQSFEEGITLPCTPEVIAPRPSRHSRRRSINKTRTPDVIAPRPMRRIPKGLQYLMAGLLTIVGLSTASYAMDLSGFREDVDWFKTRYIENDAEAYEEFIENHPESPRREKATYKKADALLQEGLKEAAEAALDTYAKAYPAGEYMEEALWKLANLTQLPDDYQSYLELPGQQKRKAKAVQAVQNLEQSVWEEVQSNANPVSLDRYLRLYPQGEHREEAIEQLAQSNTWQPKESYELPDRLRPDTTEMVNRLLRPTQERRPEPLDILQNRISNSPLQEKKKVLIEQEGIVKDIETAQAVQGATVRAIGREVAIKAIQTTDAQGRFTLSSYPEGVTVELSISAKGYRDTTLQRRVSGELLRLPMEKQDTDGDGIPDIDDRCPEEAGVKAEQGCPPPSDEPATGEVGRFPDMVSVPGGTFEMGDTFDEGGSDEKPVHTVTLSPYEIGRYEVTFAQYDAFCEATGREKPNDRGWGRGDRPVNYVSWYDAVAYCNWLSKQRGYEPVYEIEGEEVKNVNWAANGYRLPTEAEWEYAARGGGQKVRFGNGEDIARASEINFDASADYKRPYSEVGQYRRQTVPVGSLNSPNGLGLHDISGNVWEWCWDWYSGDYYASSLERNPKGPDSGSYRVSRGGGWFNDPRHCRVAYRGDAGPAGRDAGLGFRVARSSRR